MLFTFGAHNPNNPFEQHVSMADDSAKGVILYCETSFGLLTDHLHDCYRVIPFGN